MENQSQTKVDRSKLKPGDVVLVCKDCGSEFIFTAGEQKFYATRTTPTGPLNPPKRCGMCRLKKRQRYENYQLKNNHDRPNQTG